MNVFIARSPYHALLAHAVCMAERGDAEPEEYPATLIYSGTSLDAIGSIVSEHYWTNILHFSNRDNAWTSWRSGAIAAWVQQHFSSTTVDTVYLSDDMNWRDQLLEYYLNAPERCLIEDGIGSYYEAKLSTKQRVFRNTVLRAAFAGKLRNYQAVSRSRGNRYFAVNPLAFPWIQDRRQVNTIEDELRRYVSQLSFSHSDPDGGTQPELFFLTQPFYESDLLTRKQDLLRHGSLASRFHRVNEVLVKKHPRELDEMFEGRVSAIASALPEARVVSSTSPLPAELLSIQAGTESTFVSFTSTALINIKHLRPDLVVYFHPVGVDDSVASLFSRLGIRRAPENSRDNQESANAD